MTSPVAYIRRSVARTGDPGDISREFQTAKVRALANGDGDALRIIDGDWGRSAGRHKADLRAAFRALVADIEAGKVSTLYAYSTDRLARDAESAYGLLNAAERAGVTIVTSEGRFPPGDRMARQMFGFQAMQNEAALDGMSDKASSTAIRRKERGDRMGRAPYGYRHEMIDGVSTLIPREDEDPAAVVDAFKVAGSYNAAAKLLNARPAGVEVRAEDGSLIGTGVALPTRFGKDWDASTVRHVVQRHAPDLIPVTRHRGSPARARQAARFARLLLCPHADHHRPAGNRPFLTAGTAPTYTRKDGTTAKYPVRYYCAVAHTDATHPRPYIVAEAKVVAWAREALREVPGRLKIETATSDHEPAAVAKLADLAAQRDRVWTMVRELGYPLERAKADIARIDAETPALELGTRALSLLSRMPLADRGIDLDGDPGEFNAAIRNLWEHVELDPATMEPVRAVWTIGNEPPYDTAGDASVDVGR